MCPQPASLWFTDAEGETAGNRNIVTQSRNVNDDSAGGGSGATVPDKYNYERNDCRASGIPDFSNEPTILLLRMARLYLGMAILPILL